MSKMKYHITLAWNGETVLDGNATAVMVDRIMQTAPHEFAGKEVAKFKTMVPRLDDLLKMIPNDFKPGVLVDDTGKLQWVITRLGD